MFLRNDKQNKEVRRSLRKKQTPQEVIVWSRLRNNKLGHKFKRQYSVGRYILDFYCPKHKLCVEIDGSQHIKNHEYDRERSLFLNQMGIRVLRFWNNEINSSIDVVIQKIITELSSSLS